MNSELKTTRKMPEIRLDRDDPSILNQDETVEGRWRVISAGEDGGDSDDGDDETGRESGVATKVRTRAKRPNMYRVLLLNDDYTPMEFVVMILQEVFNKSSDDAWQIMMHVHKQGVGECGVFPYEVAETKVTRVMDAARKEQHPLQCVMEKK